MMTGVDPDKPSRHASWLGEIPSTPTRSTGDLAGSSIDRGPFDRGLALVWASWAEC